MKKKTFIIGVPELHYALYRVQAENLKAAKQQVKKGDLVSFELEYSHNPDSEWHVQEVKS